MMDYSAKKVLKKQPRSKKDVKARTKKSFIKCSRIICLIVVAGVLMLLSSYYLYPVVVKAKNIFYVNVAKVEISGNKILSNKEIIQQSGISRKTNILTLNIKELRNKILKNPYVQNVSIQRKFPATMEIKIKEREPYAILNDGVLWYVGSDAKPFKKVNTKANDSFDYPILTGMPGSKDSANNYRTTVLKKAVEIIKQVESRKIVKKKNIAEVNFCEIYGFSLYIGERPYRVVLGLNNIDEKLERLEKILKKLNRSPGVIRLVDLDYSEKAIVKLKKNI